MRLMDDINLDRVIVSRDGKTLRLEFIDMQQGASAGVLECINVILINYHNVLNSEGLAEYVGQVDVDEFGEEPARRRLEELRFQFLDPLGRTRVPEGRTMYHVHVEGGEICIDVCCGDYRLTTDHEKGP